jgi:hypothetical protein
MSLLRLVPVMGICISCTPPALDMGRTPEGITPHDYPDRFQQWSREIHVLPLDGLENILTARATYLGYRFREAYVERFSYDLNSTPTEKQALFASEMDALDKGHEFFVTAMSAVKNCDNLDPKTGPWTIRLKNDQGLEAAPVLIEKIEKPKPDSIKYFFFNPSYRKAYRIVFSLNAKDGAPLISTNTRSFELSFATAYGKSSARWEIQK